MKILIDNGHGQKKMMWRYLNVWMERICWKVLRNI